MLELSRQEKVLLALVRRIPPERVEQIIDFARFVQLRIDRPDFDSLILEDQVEEDRSSEASWDKLFARPEAQSLMEEMALQALAEHDAGLTQDMEFDESGNLLTAS